MALHSVIRDTSDVAHRWVFDFELIFDNEENRASVQRFMETWWWLSFPYIFVYITLIFIGRAWMSRRNEKFELRQSLVLWNMILTIFSFWGVCRCVPEFIHALTQYGFRYSVCDSSYKYGITGLWSFLFMLSKVPETIDTLFIVLRRQQLIFLHWYHHASVLIYCFYSYTFFASTGLWFVSMNFCVHTIMYGYFAMRAARLHVPWYFQQFITIIQIVQMIAGCVVNIAAYYFKQNGHSCDTSNTNIVLSLMLYVSYFVLFANFFYMTYVQKSSKAKVKKRTD